jgi:hypothetical protein
MNFIRRALVLCALWPALPALAQTPPPTFTFDKSYSAEQVVTARDGSTISMKMYNDNGRVRTDMVANGMNIIAIVLPAEQKVYSLLPDQKMIMEMPYDPAKYGKEMIGTAGFDGKTELIGPDPANGIPCNKYKVTTRANKVYFLWVDPAKNQPVKVAAQDGSFSAVWKSYLPGPQPASLFVIPTDYQMMAMPATPGGGGAPGP